MLALHEIKDLIKLNEAVEQFKKSMKGKTGMKSWLPSVGALVVSALTIFTPEIQTYITAHPSVAAALLSAYSIFTHIMPSPIQGAKK